MGNWLFLKPAKRHSGKPSSSIASSQPGRTSGPAFLRPAAPAAAETGIYHVFELTVQAQAGYSEQKTGNIGPKNQPLTLIEL